MAVVVDDLGYSPQDAKYFSGFKQALNLAVIPGQSYSNRCAKIIDESPQQLLIHFPWYNLGPKGKKDYPIHISAEMNTENIKEMLTRAFKSVPNAHGLNNHMGSAMSMNEEMTGKFMFCYAKFNNSKYFLDSNTTWKSTAEKQAKRYNIASAKNNVFLDGRQNPDYIEKQFLLAIKHAEKHGSVIAICHGNRRVTRNILKSLMQKYNQRVKYVYLSELVQRSKANAD